MDAIEALKTRRSVRRYKQKEVSTEVLKDIVEAARYAPTGGNSQNWEIILVNNPSHREDVFQTLSWLPSVSEPPEEAKPTAYMVIISDQKANVADCASLSTYILLSAHANGLGSCWLGSIRRTELEDLLDIPENYSIEFVISLGYPDEEFKIEDSEDEKKVERKGETTYVPKLTLDEILHYNSYGG